MPRRPSRRKVPSTLTERLVRHLAEQILDGRLAPGVRLEEQALADRYKVSRTPVREALQRLSATGLVERYPHRGVLVCALDDARLAQLFETMAELEAICARLCAQRMSELQRMELREIHEASLQLVEAGDIEGYVEANLELHSLLYRGTGNQILEETTQAVRRRASPFRSLQFHVAGRLRKSYEEHEAVVRAILADDSEAAARAMSLHMRTVEHSSSDYVDDHRPKAATPSHRSRA